MREINHRAKNMLSVVDAIAHQTAHQKSEDFIERFSERIQALSANQDLLIRNEWRGSKSRLGLRPACALRRSHRFSYSRARPQAAFECGFHPGDRLALCELATNAGKYGALSVDTGRVEVSWGGDGDTFSMSWTERGGPPVSVPQRRGFGTIVMEQMTERKRPMAGSTLSSALWRDLALDLPNCERAGSRDGYQLRSKMLSEGIASPHRKRGSLTNRSDRPSDHSNHSPHRNDPAHLGDSGSELGELTAALGEFE